VSSKIWEVQNTTLCRTFDEDWLAGLFSKLKKRNKYHKSDSKLKFETTAVNFKKDKSLDLDHDHYI